MSDARPRADDLAAQKRALVARLLETRGLAAAAGEKVPRRPRPDDWPLSFVQQRLWFLERLEPGSPRYNTFTALRLEGPLDAAALGQALAGVLARHEALRGRIIEVGGEPVQRIEPPGPVPLPVLDLAASGDGSEETLRRLAAEEARRPFDLAHGPLLRATLVRLAPERHVLMLSLHHVVSDGWAIGVLLSELAALYTAFREGRPSPLPPLPVQYADFAAWQRERLQGGTLEALLGYWRRQLAGAETLALPTDRPRPPVPSLAGAWCGRSLDHAPGRLQQLCREEGATAFMAVLAAFAGLLQRLTGQSDVTIGSPVAGRDRAELEGLVGCFANMLVLRTDLSGDPTFRELLRRVRAVVSAALAHQELPFERLVEELRPVRELARHPLFQVALSFQPAPSLPLAVPGCTWTPAGVDNGVAKFDLTLYVGERADGLTAAFEYSTELFDRPTIERLLGLYERLLAEALAAPDTRLSALPLLGADEERRLVEASRGALPDPAHAVAVHEQVSARAREAPDALAVQAGPGTLTYGALVRRANQLAHHLVSLGVSAEVRVAVCLERSLDLAVALLGVLKAGGAYVPLDPGYPAERLRFMLEDSGARVLVTRDGLRAPLPPAGAAVVSLDAGGAAIAGHPETDPEVVVGPAQLAYVIYTSGSTGQAKGVEVPHGGLANLAAWHRTTYGVTPSDRGTMLASLSFDASVWELWPYLVAGASVHLLPDEDLRSSPRRLGEWLARAEATLAFLPTPLAEALLGEPLPPGLRLRGLLTGGDTLHTVPPGLPFPVLNHYGPTEASVVSTWTEVAPGGPAAPPIGRAIDGTVALVLDRHLRPAPVGVPGELHVGGAGLARGYHGRPDLTAASFVPDPHADTPGGRLYRTGDRAMRLPDGQIAFLGRVDDQVKVRGFRIEPGEIEAALRSHPGVREAAVLAREDEGRPRQLAAYVVRRAGADVAAEGLRAALAARLPAYMVPSAFVFLDALPLSMNGKVDRRALPAPPPPHAGGEPRSAAERAVAAVWLGLLGIPRVGTDDDFFALGGHSLLAARVVAGLRDATGVELPLRALFESPTLGSLAARLESARTADPAEAPPPIRPRPPGDDLPLSFAQRRLWLLDQLGAGAAYNVSGALRLEGRLDAEALSRALLEIARRHESLRTTFEAAGDEPVQRIAGEPGLRLRVVDLRDREPLAREAEAERLSAEEGRLPFDLARGPLARATLLVMGDEDHVLALTLHHIVADGWSIGVFTRELAALYGAYATGTGPALPEPPVQYADYAVWQRDWLRGEVLDRKLDHWRLHLDGLAPLRLPLDRPRPATQTFRGASVSRALPRQLSEALPALGREEGATLFMVLLAGFQALLHRWSGQEDVAVGSPVANRGLREVEDVIGLFVNTIVLRADLSGNPSFRELLGRVKKVAFGAFAHQDVPFDVLVERLSVPRDPARNPLVQAAFALQNAPAGPSALPGLALRPQPLAASSTRFDVELHLQETREGLAAAFVYNTDLFEGSTVERMASQYVRLLESAVSSPGVRVSELSLLGEGEGAAMVALGRGARSAYPREGTIGGAFAEEVERHPEAVAVVFGGERLLYRELEERANRLARHLRRRGVETGDRVGLCVERSLELVVGVLGIVKAGAAYVPLEPGYPRERLRFMVEDSRPALIVTEEAFEGVVRWGSVPVLVLEREGEAIGGEEGVPVETGVGAEDLAYVTYTSGSTGVPKGVEVLHRGVLRLVRGADYARLGPEEVLLQLAPVSFDASTLELWGALLTGGRVVVYPERVPTAAGLGEVLEREGVTTLWLTASLFNAVVDERAEVLSPVRQLLIGGEALSVGHVRRAQEVLGRTLLINGYGPTEGTTFTCCHSIGREEEEGTGTIPIGRPIANTDAFVLDGGMGLVPVGVMGELYVGGDGLARGYLNRPDLTAERFVPHPYGEGGERLYRTGDRVRWLPSGRLEFLGRVDEQVKVRGFRIELGEIEAALRRQEGVAQAAVAVREEGGEKELVAYVVANGEAPTEARLRARLRESLPDYMVPGAFAFLPALPTTAHGKLDRRRLPAPPSAAPGLDGPIVEPRTPAEEAVAAAWREVLGRERVSVHDNFFDLGGHSLRLVQVHRRLRARFPDREIPVVELFRYPTVAALAAWLSGEAGGEGRKAAGPPPGGHRAGRERLEMRRGLRRSTRGGGGADA